MNKNTLKLRINPEENIVNQPLDEIVRSGTKEMLQKALEIEVNLFVERYQYILDDKGSRKGKTTNNKRARHFLKGHVNQPSTCPFYLCLAPFHSQRCLSSNFLCVAFFYHNVFGCSYALYLQYSHK